MIYTNQAKNTSNCVYEYRIILDIEFVILIYQSNLTFYRNTMSPSSTSRVDNRKDLKMITSLWSSFVRVIVG